MTKLTPLYSICMVNYNMTDTLQRAVSSVANQLDRRFEIVLVDDGSTDGSVGVMRGLVERFPLIRAVPLKRDVRRRLGETRNVSVREARGRWCLLHLDCDDVYEPHIPGWVEAFHQIENAVGFDIMVAGQHIHMAKRELLLKNGPYINIFRGEDRDMYVRFGAQNLLWFMDHIDFCTRLPKTRKQRIQRTLSHTFDHMITDFRAGTTFQDYLRFEGIKARERSLKLILLRAILLPITWLAAQFMIPIRHNQALDGHASVQDYRTAHRGTLTGLLGRFGTRPDWDKIPAESRHMFVVE